MNLISRTSTLALFGALAAAGYAGSAFAVSFPPPSVADNCGPLDGFQTSQVLDAVESLGGAPERFNYGFRVCNTANDFGGEIRTRQVIRDWELPWFGDGSGQTIGANISDIDGIVTPEGWTWAIEAIGPGNENLATGWEGVAAWQQPGDPFREFFDDFFGGAANNPYNSVTHVLHFYTECDTEGEFTTFCDNPIFEGGSLEGFGFNSSFGSTNAPYQASWIDLPVRTGDPQFPLGGQPNNPVIQAAAANVPEPGTLAMLGLGLSAMAASRRRRQSPDPVK